MQFIVLHVASSEKTKSHSAPLTGFSAWKHNGEHLRSHERSREHVDNMENWRQLVARLKLNTTIDCKPRVDK